MGYNKELIDLLVEVEVNFASSEAYNVEDRLHDQVFEMGENLKHLVPKGTDETHFKDLVEMLDFLGHRRPNADDYVSFDDERYRADVRKLIEAENTK